MVRRTLQFVIKQLEKRWIYLSARAVVLLLFGSILFFPEELLIALESPAILGVMLFATIIFAIILLGDLLTTRQKTVGSLMYKYVFLTFSIILAYGLFYYINATLFEPPGFGYLHPGIHELERDVFYFSGVTYFTIGYGDITPVGANARTAAITEAFAGNVINLVVLATAFQRWVWRNKR
ncbi:MAG: ion channel [Candidatus Micrarchaeota archaeon]